MDHFPKNSAFDPEHPSRSYQPTPLPGVNDVRVGHTRRLGVVEVPIRDIDEILIRLRFASAEFETMSSGSIRDLLDNIADTLYSHLPG